MKVILYVALSILSFSASATALLSAQEAFSHADRYSGSVNASVSSVASFNGGSNNSTATAQAEATANAFGAVRAQAASDLNAAVAADSGTQTNSTPYGYQNPHGVNPQAVSQVKADNTPQVYSGISIRPGMQSINVAASSLAPSTPVTVKGKSTVAGALPADTQVAVSFNSAFSVTRKGGNDHSRDGSRSEHSTGNGSNNAANSNSSHGLGGGNHIGGGSAESGSRNVGKW